MKLIDLIYNVERSSQNQGYLNADDLCNDFGINGYSIDYDLFQSVFKSYWLACWRCTDTLVGIRVLTCKDHIVGILEQPARKSSIDVKYLSEDYVNFVYKELLKLIPQEDQDVSILSEDELNEEQGDAYKLQYNTQIIHQFGFIGGKEVEIIKTHYQWDEGDDYFHAVEVKYTHSGEISKVDVRDIEFKYNVNR